jgi:hypothetical protein
MNCGSRLNFLEGHRLMMLPFALILKEPDLGSALVLLPTGLVMMFVAGTPKRISAAAGRRGGFAGRAVSGGRFVCAAGLVADFDAGLSARPAAGLFWAGLHGFRAAERHAGGVATPPPTELDEIVQRPAGADFRRLRRG